MPAFFPGKNGRNVKLSTYIYMVPRKRKSGATPPLPIYDVDRENFTFLRSFYLCEKLAAYWDIQRIVCVIVVICR